MNDKVLKLLDSQIDDEMIAKLIIFAKKIMRLYYWNSGVPKSMTAEDFVYDGIRKTYEAANGNTGDGTRTWNPSAVSLSTHFEGVIRSDINHLANSTDNATGHSSFEDHIEKEVADSSEVGETIVIDNVIIDDSTEVLAELMAEVAKDPVSTKILKYIRSQGMEDKFHSNKAIHEGTGIPIKEINNAKKRMTLKMKSMMNKKRTSL